MTIRRLRASITRLVLVAAMALAVAAGSVAVGPRHEAAAMPMDCTTLFNQWHVHEDLSRFYYNRTNTTSFPGTKVIYTYNPYLGLVHKLAANAYWNSYLNFCS